MEVQSNTVADFMHNLPEKFPSVHKQNIEPLVIDMLQRTELILDFNGLQASIDPALDYNLLDHYHAESTAAKQEEEEEGCKKEEEKINYEQIMMTYFNTNGTLTNLLTFKLRGFDRACADFPLADGIRQLHSLTELDLAGNKLSTEMQENLQLWSLTEIHTLKLDTTGLKQVPPSIGRLRKLQHLSLSDNSLSSLPVTLSFCQAINYLNISKNKFNAVPGVILQLKNLNDLRRLDNPLPKRWEGYERFPHFKKSSLKPTKKTNPDSLQALCTKTVMTCHVDYWSESNFPPLQCKMLDSFASMYTYCEKCHNAINTTGSSSEGWIITVMVPKFADLRDVPFRVHACTNCCNAVEQQLTESQRQLLQEMDEEYEETMKQAMKEEGMTFEIRPPSSNNNTRRRRRHRTTKKCTIM